MSLFWWATVFLLLYYGTSVSSFPLNDIQMEPKTRSHSAITSDAVYKAVATFLDRMQLVSNTSQPPDLKVKTYFGTGKIIKPNSVLSTGPYVFLSGYWRKRLLLKKWYKEKVHVFTVTVRTENCTSCPNTRCAHICSKVKI